MDILDLIDGVQSVADGVLFGATYALLGIGFTLIFGVMHKINLSYAAASIGAAYASLLILAAFKAPAIVVFLMAAAAGGVIGALVYVVGFKFIPLANPLATLMSTVGLLLLIDEIIVHTTDGIPLNYPALFSDVIIRAGPFNIRGDLVFVFLLGCVCMVVLLLLLYRTKLGLATRAVSQQPVASQLCGISITSVNVLTFVITGMIGGIAGAMTGAAIGMLSPLLSLPLTVKGLIVTVIGGLGSIPGAILAGLIVGGLENFFQFFRGVTERDLYIMLLLVPVPCFQAGRLVRHPPADATDGSRRTMDFYLGLAQIVGVHTLLGLSAYCVLLTGQVSLAQAGFFAIGAYVAAMLTVLAGWPLVYALLVSGVVSGAVACAVGFPALAREGADAGRGDDRIRRGGAAVLLQLHLSDPSRQPEARAAWREGFRQIRYFPENGWSTLQVLIFIWVVVVLVMAALWWFDRSRAGAVFRAVGEDELAAQSVGINITAVKVSAMTIGGVIAGIGGGLFAHYTTHIEHIQFGVVLATFAIAYPILGGLSNVFGTLIAVVFIQAFLIEGLRFMGDWRNLLFGGLIVLAMNLRPRGIARFADDAGTQTVVCS